MKKFFFDKKISYFEFIIINIIATLLDIFLKGAKP